MKQKSLISIVLHNAEKLLLIFIVLIAVYLRFYQVFSGMPWVDDSGRDMLVARHLVNQSAPLWSAPPASGVSFLSNTPLYFWIIGLIYFFGRSVTLVVIMFAFIGVLTIVLGYKLGKMLHSGFIGIMLAALISFSYIIIIPSRSILQPNLTGLFVVLTIIFYIRFHRSKSFYDGIIFVLSMYGGIALHLGYLPVFVYFSIALAYELLHLQVASKRLGIFLLYAVTLFCWVAFYVDIVSLRKVFPLLHTGDGGLVWQNVGLGLLNFSNYLFFGAPVVLQIFLGIAVLALLIIKRVPRYLKQLPTYIIAGGFYWIVTLLLLCLIYGKNAPYYYYNSYFIIALIGFALLIDRVIPLVLKFTLALLFIVGIAYSSSAIITNEQNMEFAASRTVSIRVLEDYAKYSNHEDPAYNFWVVAATGAYPGIFGMLSEHYWYILEVLTKVELTTIVSGPQNSRPLVRAPRFIYLLCQVGEFNYASRDECVAQMSSHYVNEFDRMINPILVDTVITPLYAVHIVRYERVER